MSLKNKVFFLSVNAAMLFALPLSVVPFSLQAEVGGGAEGVKAATQQFQVIGRLTKLEGKVFATREDIDKKQPLNVGDRVFSDDIILTEGKGKVEIQFLDDSVLSLGSGSRTKLDSFVYDPKAKTGSSNYEVMSGFFRFVSGGIAAQNPGAMKIETPVATIGIRGTIGGGDLGNGSQPGKFFVEQNPDGTTGSFNVTAGGQTVTLNRPNMTTEVQSRTSTPTPPVAVSSTTFKGKFGRLDGFASNGRFDNGVNNAEPPKKPEQKNQEANPPEPEPEVKEENKSDESQQAPEQEDQADAEKPQESIEAGENSVAEEGEGDEASTQSGNQSADSADAGTSTTEAQNAPTEEPATSQKTEQERAKTFRRVNPDLPNDYQELQRNPNSLLEKFPEGGPKMAKYVSEAVQQYPELSESVLEATEGASSAQAAAAGVGLSRAARYFSETQPELGQKLSGQVAAAQNSRVKFSFKALGPLSAGAVPPAPPPPVQMRYESGVNVGSKMGYEQRRNTTSSSIDYRNVNNLRNKINRLEQRRQEKGLESGSLENNTSGRIDGALSGKIESQTKSTLGGGVFGGGSILSNPATAAAVSGYVASQAAQNEAISVSPTK